MALFSRVSSGSAFDFMPLACPHRQVSGSGHHLGNDRERTWIDKRRAPEGARNAALVWIIGVGDSDTKVEKSILSCTPSQLSSRTQRGLERTSAAVRRTAQRSCISLLLSLGDIRAVTSSDQLIPVPTTGRTKRPREWRHF